MNSNILNLQYKLLQDKSLEFRKENIEKMRTHKELIKAFEKKYTILYSIINKNGIQYKQFLSCFFNCILLGSDEPYLIPFKKKINNNKKEKSYYLFNEYTSNYNYLRLFPWDKYNIVKCTNNTLHKIRINKEQFMETLIILFPRFIKKFPNILLDLNEKLKNIKSDTISTYHLYKYLVYCGDKLSKDDISKGLKNPYFFKFNKYKINNFLKVFTVEQLIKILNN